MRTQIGSTALACAVGIFKSTSQGDIVTFDNASGTFVLVADGNLLDPTLPPHQQQAAESARSMAYLAAVAGGSQSPQADTLFMGAAIRIARSTTSIDVTNAGGATFSFFPAQVFAHGEAVGPGPDFQPIASAALFFLGAGHFHTPFLGQSPYTGFRLDLPDGPHFGWVQWNFTIGPLAGGGEIPMYQPFRWAYETEPNTPIIVPGVGSGAALLLAAGVLGVVQRRRA